MKAEVTDKREARDAALDAFANDPMFEAMLRDEARIAFAGGSKAKTRIRTGVGGAAQMSGFSAALNF